MRCHLRALGRHERAIQIILRVCVLTRAPADDSEVRQRSHVRPVRSESLLVEHLSAPAVTKPLGVNSAAKERPALRITGQEPAGIERLGHPDVHPGGARDGEVLIGGRVRIARVMKRRCPKRLQRLGIAVLAQFKAYADPLLAGRLELSRQLEAPARQQRREERNHRHRGLGLP